MPASEGWCGPPAALGRPSLCSGNSCAWTARKHFHTVLISRPSAPTGVSLNAEGRPCWLSPQATCSGKLTHTHTRGLQWGEALGGGPSVYLPTDLHLHTSRLQIKARLVSRCFQRDARFPAPSEPGTQRVSREHQEPPARTPSLKGDAEWTPGLGFLPPCASLPRPHRPSPADRFPGAVRHTGSERAERHRAGSRKERPAPHPRPH